MRVGSCEQAPVVGDEIDVYDALDVMRTTTGTVLCKECGAAIALGPLVAEG